VSEERDLPVARQRQFLAVYARARAEDQLRWYQGRLDEFTRARAQAVTLTGVLLILTTLASALAAADAGGQRTLWAVLATIFPALSVALAGYVALHGYHRVTKLYGDAVGALRRLDAPEPASGETEAAPDDIDAYVENVENVLRREQSQWGQLQSEATGGGATKPGTPPP
jgi:hypothetical protein